MPDLPSEPLSAVVSLLRPSVSISKRVEARGHWQVERRDMGSPFYCALVEGSCQLVVSAQEPVTLHAGDFVLIPDLQSFVMASDGAAASRLPRQPLEAGPGQFRLGPPEAPVTMRALVGHCSFASPARDLLVSLMPRMIHISGHARLMALVPVIHEETRAARPGRDLILEHLLAVLLIEALRSGTAEKMPPGLLRGLADPQLSGALARIHK
ncbi:AraC family transcriptional regulator, partial [Thioclava sp. BHET1]